MAQGPVAAALPERDYESLPRREILALLLEAFPGRVSLACSFQKEEAVLLDMLLTRMTRTLASSRSTPRCSSPRPTRSGARSSAATAPGSRSTRVRSLGAPGRAPRRGALGAQPDTLLRDPQGRAARARARRPRRAGSPACAATSRRRARGAEARLGRDHELWKANPLADWDDERCFAYLAERGLPLQRAARPRATPRSAAPIAQSPGSRARGPLGGTRKDRVRPAPHVTDLPGVERAAPRTPAIRGGFVLG